MAEAVNVVQYRAVDGTMFDNEMQADLYNADLYDLWRLDVILGNRPTQHGECFGHSAESVQRYHRELIQWSRRRLPEYPGWQTISKWGDEVHPVSIIARLASDVGGPLNRAWQRRACIDRLNQEWQQPYFANKVGY